MAQMEVSEGEIFLFRGHMRYLTGGEGSPVVLLHPLGRTARSWRKVLGPLSITHSVYALDMMGHGDSDKPSRDFTMDDYAQSVLEFMEVMELSKVGLIGNSIGATMASIVAANYPEMVRKLVLVGCPLRENDEERRESLEMAIAQYDEQGQPLPKSMDDLAQTYVHVDDELQKTVNADCAKAGVWAWKALVALNAHDPLPVMKRLNCPTLLIFGEKDRLRAKEQTLKALIKDSRLVIIPDAGHLPQADNPKAFLEAMLPFLR